MNTVKIVSTVCAVYDFLPVRGKCFIVKKITENPHICLVCGCGRRGACPGDTSERLFYQPLPLSGSRPCSTARRLARARMRSCRVFSSRSSTAASASNLLFSSSRDQVACPLELVLWAPGPPRLRSFWIEVARKSDAFREGDISGSLIRNH